MVLHQRHLGDKIGCGDQLRLGIAAGEGEVKAWPSCLQCGDGGMHLEIVIAQGNIELIEDNEAEGRVGHEFYRLRPGLLRGGDVALEILRLPGEALAHSMPGDLIGKHRERVALRRVPRSFDELNDADAVAAAEHAQRKTEGRGGLASAGAGMDDKQTLFNRLGGNLRILHRLALRHLGAMTLGLALVNRSAHLSSLMMSGNPATTRTTQSARAAMRWLSSPWASRKRRPRGLSGTMPKPTSLATSTSGRVVWANAASRHSISASTSAPASNAFESHSVKQSTSMGIVPWAASAPTTSRGVSRVVQPVPRRARCLAMRSAISASPGSAVAT